MIFGKVYKHPDPEGAPRAVSLHSRRGTSGITRGLDSKIIYEIEIGQPFDQEISDVTVDNLTAENTGDDSLALFNVVKNARISDCNIKYRFPLY